MADNFKRMRAEIPDMSQSTQQNICRDAQPILNGRPSQELRETQEAAKKLVADFGDAIGCSNEIESWAENAATSLESGKANETNEKLKGYLDVFVNRIKDDHQKLNSFQEDINKLVTEVQTASDSIHADLIGVALSCPAPR